MAGDTDTFDTLDSDDALGVTIDPSTLIGADFSAIIEEIGASDDPSAHKVCRLIDSNLFVSSSDSFRRHMGGYFTPNPTGSMEFTVFEYNDPNNIYVTTVATIKNLVGYPLNLPAESQLEYPPIVPRQQFVCSIKGNPSTVKDDLMWKALWKGGTHEEVAYPAMMNDGIYEDHYIMLNRPYSQIDSHLLHNPNTVTSYMKVSYDYQFYLPDYQNYATLAKSELHLPNWYMMRHAGFETYVSSSTDMPTAMYNFLSLDGKIPSPWEYFRDPALFPELKRDDSQMQLYLDMVSTGSLSTETEEKISEKHKNIFFNSDFYADYDSYNLDVTGAMPYGATVSFEKETPGLISEYIKGHKFDTRFLRLLKSSFLNQQSRITPHEIEYTKQLTYLTSSQEAQINDEVVSFSNVKYRTVDVIDLLLYSYDKINCDYEDFTIIDSKNLITAATYDTRGVYRYANTMATINMLSSMVSTVESSNKVQTMSGLLNGQPQQYDTEAGTTSAYESAPEPKYTEVLAYRIEKTGITTPGIEGSIQNFWFINTDRTNAFQFFDSQVKYNKDYTYKIYSYNIVIGLKYQYSNLQLSRVIGETHDALSALRPITGYCIEYYDPNTDQAVIDLVNSGSYGTVAPISQFATESQRIISRAAGDTTKPYMAQFVVTTEPSIKIVEIPLFEKTLRILDHPPNRINVVPSFTKDDTNRLSFMASYQPFDEEEYPPYITSENEITKAHYLNANDLLESVPIDLETVSRHSNIEVYRTDIKPTSFEDFDEHYLEAIPLSWNTYDASYNDTYFYDKVKSNKKYYYLFRSENQLGMTGYFSQILEAELINDGGYKYAVFNTLFERDLKKDSFIQTNTPAKKLFQISPAAQQISLMSENADFANTALEEFQNVSVGQAEDSLWDQTFKIRLTSKKTTKKIDLNITYHQTDYIE